jgi:hypothetical protein
MLRCLFSFVTRARPSRPFYTLRATPILALNFGWSVGRSQGCHMNDMLPLQFRHPGPPFPTLLRPAGHPQNGLKFWLIGRSVTGKSHERHAATSVSLPEPAFPTLLRHVGHPQNSLKFWLVGQSVGRLVGQSIGWSVTGKSHKRHAASLVSSPGPALPDPSMPCGPPTKWP